METTDVVIAGAGIIGLSLALDLGRHGLKVTVLERGQAMSEASWAAAGMLAANDPENPPDLLPLSQLSLREYPKFLSNVERLSGKKVPLRTNTTLQALPPDHLDPLNKLSLAELRHIAPHLNPEGHSFLRLDEQSLDPRDLCAALPLAAKAAGVRLIENSAVVSIDHHEGRVIVQTPSTPIAATHFVNCAGAWSESPALSSSTSARFPPANPAVTPCKGQMTTVCLKGNCSLNTVLRTPDFYIVPRGDGRATIGATVEDCGYDKTVEPCAIANLLQSAANLYPPIADAEILESWAGLRPASADRLPLIGSLLPPHCWIATGHFRNGILLAPATARVLSQLIRGESPEVDLSVFDPSRFGHRSNRPFDRLVPQPSDKPATAAL